jgi:adenylate cyclase
MLIPFVKTWADSYDRIYMERVVLAKEDGDDSVYRDGLTGQIALAAEVTTTQKDVGPTAFEGLYPLSGIHAAVLSGLLSGSESFIAASGLWFKVLSFIILFILLVSAFSIKKDIFFHISFLAVLLCFSALVLLRWQVFRLTPWYTSGTCCIVFSWVAAFAVRLIGRYHEQALLQNALSRYFHPDLALSIIREGRVDLTPSYKELSILFSDISGFTRWSSDKRPELVHRFLSEFHGAMADIVFARSGSVDKFMGDGMLAFFGDPVDLPDHADLCVSAAMEMQRKAREISAEWKGRTGRDLGIRIGINTGRVIAGNLGSGSRIEYTVIGAAVNLAQRMESNAPVGGILITAAARNALRQAYPFGEKRAIAVKGYDGPEIEVYTIEPGVFEDA